MKPQRRHLLICRAPTGPNFVNAVFDGKRWAVDEAEPRRLEVVLLTLQERLLPQIKSADFTISPFRRFADFDRRPDEFALPDGRPVAIACRLSQAPHERGFWKWLIYHAPDQPPIPSGQRFSEAKLEDEIANKLRLDSPAETWAADRELWLRHGLTQAALTGEAV